jgi:dephospho-CoA kinase
MLLGIVGTHGAGKGAVVQFLKEHGFIHCSARELFLEELARQGVAADRPSISSLAIEMRKKYGVDYVVRTFLERYDPVSQDIVIESIYTMGEAAAIRSAGGYVLSVDADSEARYERIKHRMSETDFVTKEEFLKKQEQESRSDDAVGQDARTVMEDADFHIENNDGIKELKIQVDYMLEKMAQNKDI